jgi:class 3 adenylate cyclase
VQLPETRYARSGELAIAYQVHGEGEHDLLFSGTVASNVETVWTLPEAHRFFERLGRFARVIRFDRRDTGVSDPIRDDLTLESHVADALAVMDAVGAVRPMLFGGLDGARSLAALAATRPERAAGLIALTPTVRGPVVDSPELAEVVVAGLVDDNWPARLIDIWAPGWTADPARLDRAVRYVRTSVGPRQARRLFEMSLRSDISEVLPLVQAPTLVLAPEDAQFPEASQREFAELIPGAVFRRIPGDALMVYALDVDLIADMIEEFVTGTAPAPVSSRVLATVLFTDVVGSTGRVAQVGDAEWARLLQAHHATVAAAVAAHDGELVKTLGDGVLAVFSGPAQGVRCAAQAIAEARAAGLELRTGLHTGEVERVSDDVAGLAVHLAARIMDRAGPGEVLVSRTVKDLVVGSRLRFEDRGEHELKGIPERWALYAATE